MIDRTLMNGAVATAEELAPLAFAGFAHFTAMQVRNGQVRGLDLHLERLRSASLDLFGRATPDDQVVADIARATAMAPDISLMVTVFLRSGEFTRADNRTPAVLVRTAPPFDGPSGPLRLAVVRHERWCPGIKHVGEGAKTFYLHHAIAKGFDDATFIDHEGRLAEATIWNLAFWDGTSVIWPKASMLQGVTMSILKRQLLVAGVPQREAPLQAQALDGLAGAVVMNSWSPAVPVSSIGDHHFTGSDELVRILRNAYALEPWRNLA